MAELDIDINIQTKAWLEELPDIRTLSNKACTLALDKAGISAHTEAIEVSILLSDDVFIQKLNHRYRQKDAPTNVLSFPQNDLEAGNYSDIDGDSMMLGDVVLSLDTLIREAEEQDKPLQDHATHLLVHGLLHLIGHDHIDPTQATEMEALEKEILEMLGVPDPYM